MKTELLKLKPNVEELTTKDLKNIYGGTVEPASDKGDASRGGAEPGAACCCACRPTKTQEEVVQ